MRYPRFAALALAAVLVVACEDSVPFDPESGTVDDAAAQREASLDVDYTGQAPLGVLSWNIYVGANLTQLLAVDPSRIACGVADVYGDVLATDFAARAVGIADQIELYQPGVIGLNEVSTFDFQYGFFHPDLVFLDILLQELASRGLDYAAPLEARSTNFQIALPISYAPDCSAQDLLSYTEHDVLLVRGDVDWTGADHGNFAVPLPLPYGLPPKYSGWAYVDVVHEGATYRVFTTHLEPADTGPCATDDPGLLMIHSMQADELINAVLPASPHRTILSGDLNSDASGCTTETYPDLIDAGFVDAWTTGRPRGDGFTSNQDGDLRNETSALFHRIDFVLYRDAFTELTGRFPGVANTRLVGEEPEDRVPTGSGDLVWPSDHAGVMAFLKFADGPGR